MIKRKQKFPIEDLTMRTKNENTINSIIDFINDKYFNEGYVPSLQEIADHIGITKGAVSKYISTMEERGLLNKSGSHYGITTPKMEKVQKSIQYIPVVGDIACGTPILAEQNIETYLTITSEFLGNGTFFVLKAKGESMIDAGIQDGDYVIIRQQSTAEIGQIIVAMTEDGECTLKRYFIDTQNKRIRLHPENNAMKDMYYDRVQIQGIAVKVIKDLA